MRLKAVVYFINYTEQAPEIDIIFLWLHDYQNSEGEKTNKPSSADDGSLSEGSTQPRTSSHFKSTQSDLHILSSLEFNIVIPVFLCTVGNNYPTRNTMFDILLANSNELNLNLLKFACPLYIFPSLGFLSLPLIFLKENSQWLFLF